MLLIPVHKKIDWKNAPIITILLILSNVFIFLFFQLDDDEKRAAAFDYYNSSGLAKIELPAAIKFADESGDFDLSERLNKVKPTDFPYWAAYLQTNAKYIKALHDGELITYKDPAFDEWNAKRQEFDRLYESITTVHYSLRTAQPTAVTLFTNMFLHGGFGHLIGNIIFLLAVGMLVEETMDSLSYLILYLLAGLGSSAFDLVFNSGEMIPHIGASGAISGLIGANAVLYGLQRIRFFYFIGVYFNYIKLPAFIFLPAWIIDQLIQIALEPDSGVNYMVHVGGAISGAVIGFIAKKTLPTFKQEKVEQVEKVDKFTEDLQQARDLINEFKPEAALAILRRLYRENPDNREILASAYKCSRIEPASEEYHALAHAIFSLNDSDPATDKLVKATFAEYLRLARPATRMNSDIACRLANRFVRLRAAAEAERLMGVILTKKLPCAENNRLIQAFFTLLQENGRHDEIQKYKKLLSTSLPA